MTSSLRQFAQTLRKLAVRWTPSTAGRSPQAPRHRAAAAGAPAVIRTSQTFDDARRTPCADDGLGARRRRALEPRRGDRRDRRRGRRVSGVIDGRRRGAVGGRAGRVPSRRSGGTGRAARRAATCAIASATSVADSGDCCTAFGGQGERRRAPRATLRDRRSTARPSADAVATRSGLGVNDLDLGEPEVDGSTRSTDPVRGARRGQRQSAGQPASPSYGSARDLRLG